MTDYTLREIIDYPPIRKGDGWDISIDMDAILEHRFDLNAAYVEYTGVGITQDIVIDVEYDFIRGARTSVLKWLNIPFAVVTRAGRDLDDLVSCYVINETYCKEAVRDYHPLELMSCFDVDDTISVHHWDIIPVKLGDKGRKTY